MTHTPKPQRLKSHCLVALDARVLLEVLEKEKKGIRFKFPDSLTVAALRLEKSLNDLK